MKIRVLHIWMCVVISVLPASTAAQSSSPASQSTGPSTVTPLPLSGRGGQQGSVSTSQSTTNAGGGNSVILSTGSVNVQGPYAGSTAVGTNTGTIISLALEQAVTMGLHYNLGAISQAQAVRQAEGQERVARSSLLPNLNTVVNETVKQINLRTLGVLQSSLPCGWPV